MTSANICIFRPPLPHCDLSAPVRFCLTPLPPCPNCVRNRKQINKTKKLFYINKTNKSTIYQSFLSDVLKLLRVYHFGTDYFITDLKFINKRSTIWTALVCARNFWTFIVELATTNQVFNNWGRRQQWVYPLTSPVSIRLRFARFLNPLPPSTAGIYFVGPNSNTDLIFGRP